MAEIMITYYLPIRALVSIVCLPLSSSNARVVIKEDIADAMYVSRSYPRCHVRLLAISSIDYHS
jgi:hypothetical protein